MGPFDGFRVFDFFDGQAVPVESAHAKGLVLARTQQDFRGDNLQVCGRAGRRPLFFGRLMRQAGVVSLIAEAIQFLARLHVDLPVVNGGHAKAASVEHRVRENLAAGRARLDDVKSAPAAGGRGAFYIVKPSPTGGEILSHAVLDGRCFGVPTVYNGKIYVQTSKKLYCFGNKGDNPGLPHQAAEEEWPAPGPAAHLQIIPAEVLLRPGQNQSFRVRALDGNGLAVEEIKDPKSIKWAHYVPPTARVRAALKGEFNEAGVLVAAP